MVKHQKVFIRLLLAGTCLLAGAIFWGCAEESTTGPGGSHEVPFALGITDDSGGTHNGAALLYVTFGANAKSDATHVKSVRTNSPPVIDGAVDSVWATAPVSVVACAPMSGNNNISAATVKSLHTATDIYFLVSWVDPTGTKNTRRHRYTYNNGTWSENDENEDRVFFMWDIGGAANNNRTFAEAGCAVACHGDMHPLKGKADFWHWKATRTDPVSYSDDQYGDSTGRSDDDGSSAYDDNGELPTPDFQAPNDPGANAPFLYRNVSGKLNAVPYSSAGWKNGDELAAYLNKIPSGSRGDIHAKGKYNDATNTWTVEFKRALNTGHADDAVITTQ